MSKTLISNNGHNQYPSNEDEMIMNLKSRVETLLSEITKLSGISNEALQNNMLWYKKYEKLKELYLKNINDELTLEDLISGKLEVNAQELVASKPIKSESEAMVEEIVKKNKEVEAELMKRQEELNGLKSQWNKMDMNEMDPNEIERNIERKYQGKMNEIEEEIRRIKKENQDRETNVQNFENLSNDFNKLKEEKKKMEMFYQKKLKEMELEKKKKKTNLSVSQKNKDETTINTVISMEKNIINNPGTSTMNTNIANNDNSNNNNNNINNNMGPNNSNLNDNKTIALKGFGELETIKEIRTIEKIEEGNKDQISEKKLKAVIEESQDSKKKLPQPQMSNPVKKGTTVAGKQMKKETNVKKTNKK